MGFTQKVHEFFILIHNSQLSQFTKVNLNRQE